MGYLSKIVSRSAAKNIRPLPAKTNGVNQGVNDIIGSGPENKTPHTFSASPAPQTFSENIPSHKNDKIDNPIKQDSHHEVSKNDKPAVPDINPVFVRPDRPEINKKIISIPAMSSPFIREILKPLRNPEKQIPNNDQDINQVTSFLEPLSSQKQEIEPKKEKLILNKEFDKEPESITQAKLSFPERNSKKEPVLKEKPSENFLRQLIQPNNPAVHTIKTEANRERPAEGKISIGKIIVDVGIPSPLSQNKERGRRISSSQTTKPEKVSKLSFGLGQI